MIAKQKFICAIIGDTALFVNGAKAIAQIKIRMCTGSTQGIQRGQSDEQGTLSAWSDNDAMTVMEGE